jgi:endonuclease III
MANTVRNNHNGVIPSDYEVLTSLANIERKSALLMGTEVFGNFLGFPSDVHVWKLVVAFQLATSEQGASKFSAEVAECSIS